MNIYGKILIFLLVNISEIGVQIYMKIEKTPSLTWWFLMYLNTAFACETDLHYPIVTNDILMKTTTGHLWNGT